MSARASWYSVKNVVSDSAEISIYDEIGMFGVSAKSFIAELKGLGDRHVTLRINSPGGEVFEGNAIYNALRRHPGGVTVAIDSLAASMATVIAMAGDKRTMAENGMFMVHNPWTLAAGESKDLRRSADMMDDLKANIVSAYAGRTGMDRDELSEMMDAETWLTAAEAKEYGFITDITEPMQAAAKFSGSLLDKFDKAPRSIMAANKFTAFLATLAKNFSIEGDEHTEESILAALKDFPQAKANLVTAQARVTELEGIVTAKDAEITSYTAKISEHVQTIADRDASIVTLTADRDDKVKNLAAVSGQYENLKKSHGLLHAQNVPEVDPNPRDAAETVPALVLEYFNEATTPERRATIYKDHAKDILPYFNKPLPKKLTE